MGGVVSYTIGRMMEKRSNHNETKYQADYRRILNNFGGARYGKRDPRLHLEPFVIALNKKTLRINKTASLVHTI